VDLHHLAGTLATASGNGRIADVCHVVQRLVDGHEARSPIIAQRHVGARMAPSHWISIFFPPFLDRCAFFQEPGFASVTAWGGLLTAYISRAR